MNTRTFKNYPALTAEMAFDLIDAIKARGWNDCVVHADFGASNVSCSAYAEISVFSADEDEHLETIKVRFSDHADYHGSDITLRIDTRVDAVYEDGEYIETRITNEDYEAILVEAMEFVSAQIEIAANSVPA